MYSTVCAYKSNFLNKDGEASFGVKISPHYFKKISKQFIADDFTLRCDGIPDCDDFTDEIGCDSTSLCDPRTVRIIPLYYPRWFTAVGMTSLFQPL